MIKKEKLFLISFFFISYISLHAFEDLNKNNYKEKLKNFILFGDNLVRL